MFFLQKGIRFTSPFRRVENGSSVLLQRDCSRLFQLHLYDDALPYHFEFMKLSVLAFSRVWNRVSIPGKYICSIKLLNFPVNRTSGAGTNRIDGVDAAGRALQS